jgi:hypothetical protein
LDVFIFVLCIVGLRQAAIDWEEVTTTSEPPRIRGKFINYEQVSHGEMNYLRGVFWAWQVIVKRAVIVEER